MESLHLLLHTHWDLEPFVPEDGPVFPLSAFRFPLFPHGSWGGVGIMATNSYGRPPRLVECQLDFTQKKLCNRGPAVHAPLNNVWAPLSVPWFWLEVVLSTGGDAWARVPSFHGRLRAGRSG